MRYGRTVTARPDNRIAGYIELTERLRHGEYGLQARAGDPDRVGRLGRSLEGVYRDFRELIPYNRIGCALLEEHRTILRACWARSDQPEILLARGYSAPMAGSSLEDVLCTGRPRILNDLPAYLRHKPHSLSTRLVVEEGFRSSLTCPLIAAGVPAGFLFFSSVGTDIYAPDHVDTFLRIAGHLSVIVEKARLVSELDELKQRVEGQR